MRKGWIGEALGKRGPSASYTSYQSKKTQPGVDEKGSVRNSLPAGNRIGTKNKVRGYSVPKNSGNQVNATVDAQIGQGPKVDFDRKNKRTPISIAAPTSERGSSGKKGPSTYNRGR